MKKLAVIFVLILMGACKKMDHYEIIGTVDNIPDSSIINLFELSENVGTLISRDTIIDGKFTFKGILTDRPIRMNLMIADRLNFSGSCEMWVDNTKIKISGSGKFLSTWKVKSNIPEQGVSNLFSEKTRDQMEIIDSLSLARMINRDNNIQTINNEISSMLEVVNNIEFHVLEKNYNNIISLEKLYNISKSSKIDKGLIRNVFNKMDDTYKNTLIGEGILSELSKPIAPKIGDKMIDLDLHDFNGKQYKLSEFSGKYILLDFWSYACYPCLLAAPELREINSTFKNSLTVIGISMDVNPKVWHDATKRDSITWINLSDGKGSYSGASSFYVISGMPTYILINPQDTIIERWEGFTSGEFKEKLNKYIDLK